MTDRGIVGDDTVIINAVLGGDTEAFRHLVDRHRDTVYAILLRLASDPEVAEELAQETFVRAWRSLDGFRGDARFGTWLVQIALHAARDHHRGRKRAKVVSLEELQEKSGDAARLEEPRRSFDPTSDLDARELRERLEDGIRALPPAYREVFVLRHLEEMPYEEIASITGSSVGSLKVRSHRARKLLREYLETNGNGARSAQGR